MTLTLKPGDKAIIFGLAGELRRYNGTRCTVLSENIGAIAKSATTDQPQFVDGYRVDSIGGQFIVPRENLRRPRDIDRVVSWQSCGWIPSELRA